MSFNAVEQMLCDVLAVVPFEHCHQDVWSPKLATVLLEACSQLDSLFKYQAEQSSCLGEQKLSISDFYAYFGEHLSGKWVLFWGESVNKFRPYESWVGGPYQRTQYVGHELEWWKAYNHLKHSRLRNRKEAKLRHAVDAVGGLFLALLDCEVSREVIATSGWLQSPNSNPAAALDDALNPTPFEYVVAESKLFSYPAGWMKQQIMNGFWWGGPASSRFRKWFPDEADRAAA